MGRPFWRSPSEVASEAAKSAQPTSSRPAVVFDLKGTLMDDSYSLKCAVHAILQKFPHPNLHQHSYRNVAFFLEMALRTVRGEYHRNEITREEADWKVVHLFFRDVGLPEPDQDQVNGFHAVFNPAYHKNGRPTRSSIELLVRLREWNVKVAAVAEYPLGSALEAADKHGWGHLVDAIVTRQMDEAASQAGCSEHPDVGMFQKAVDELGVSAGKTTVILGGDCICLENHNGAFAATFGRTLRFVHDLPFLRSVAQRGDTTSLSELKDSFESEKPPFVPYDPHPPADGSLASGDILWNGNTVTFVRPQMDVITAARLNFWLEEDKVRELARHMGGVLKDIEAARYASTLPRLAEMLVIISEATYKVCKSRVDVSYYLRHGDREPEPAYIPNLASTYNITERANSMLVEFGTRAFEVPRAPPRRADADMDLVLGRLNLCCIDIEQGRPKSALGALRSVMYTMADLSGLQIAVSVDGEW